MKKILFVSAAALSAFAARAQAFEEGHHYISAGYGVGNLIQIAAKKLMQGTNKEYSKLGPMFFKYEYAVSPNVGFGLNVAYARVEGLADDTFSINGSQIFNYKLTMHYTSWSALARVNFHLSKDERFDPYIGLGLGYGSKKLGWGYSDSRAGKKSISIPNFFPLGFEMTFGVRYMPTPIIGLYAELGLAKALIQGGIAIKI